MKQSKKRDLKAGKLVAHVCSDLGNVRGNNEDNYLLRYEWNRESSDSSSAHCELSLLEPKWTCFGVFDGMGGEEYGERAAALATMMFLKQFSDISDDLSFSEIDMIMEKAFLQANRAIVEENTEGSILGTTGSIVCTNGKYFKIYHIGDSRIYLLRKGELHLLTRDQTLAALKIELGFYHDGSPEAEEERFKLMEYIGCDLLSEKLMIQMSQWNELKYQDKILICSDGLSDMCKDAEICQILKTCNSAKDAAEKLMRTAVDNGGADNVTALVLMCSEEI